MLAWLKAKWPTAPAQKQAPKKQNPKAVVHPPYVRGYTLAEFRSNKALVEQARQFFHESALGGHIMAVLYNGMPSGNRMDPRQGLGLVQGHMGAIATLHALCEPMAEDNQPEVDYGASEANGDPWENAPLNEARHK